MADTPEQCDICSKEIDVRGLLSGTNAQSTPTARSLGWMRGHLMENPACTLCKMILWIINKRASPSQVEAASMWNSYVSIGPVRIGHDQIAIGVYAPSRSVTALKELSAHVILPSAPCWDPTLRKLPVHARTVRNTSFDVDLVQSWLSQCDSSHGPGCVSQPSPQASEIGLRLIDVYQNCIVPVTKPHRYAALSYVWGKVQQPVLRKAHEGRWHQPGAFLALNLPATIRDAMIVCGLLGISYLWVDSLCIVQDDQLDVHAQINHMDAIYSEAYVTIVAASGTSSRSGLPSLGFDRDPIQFTTTVDGLIIGTALLSLKRELEQSKWFSRAWTLQEFALSRRCLIFTADHVSFTCGDGTQCEDLDGEHTGPNPAAERRHGDRLGIPSAEDPSISNKPMMEIFANVYGPLATAYIGREVTYASDAMRAFQGILAALEKSTQFSRHGFRWGLPNELMRLGLCWAFNGQHKRRDGFPSWSWLGWDFRGGTATESDVSLGSNFEFLVKESHDLTALSGTYHWRSPRQKEPCEDYLLPTQRGATRPGEAKAEIGDDDKDERLSWKKFSDALVAQESFPGNVPEDECDKVLTFASRIAILEHTGPPPGSPFRHSTWRRGAVIELLRHSSRGVLVLPIRTIGGADMRDGDPRFISLGEFEGAGAKPYLVHLM